MNATFRDIPGYDGCYAINRDGQVLSRERTIMRSNGRSQHVQPRLLRQFRQRATGLVTVTLCRAGEHHTYVAAALVRQVWGPQRSSASARSARAQPTRDGGRNVPRTPPGHRGDRREGNAK